MHWEQLERDLDKIITESEKVIGSSPDGSDTEGM